MAIQRTPMTRPGHERLRTELERLKRVERPAITKAIAEARAHGDVSGKEVTYQIVGSEESDPTRGRISILAPLARTLIGRKVGDTVTAQLPAGKKTFQILAANFPLPENS